MPPNPPELPYYPLIVVPLAIAIFLFWRRARRHWTILRAGRPLNRLDRQPDRWWGVLRYVIAQERLLRDPVPGLMHAFVFWGFLVLLVTTGNYLTNGLVEAIVTACRTFIPNSDACCFISGVKTFRNRLTIASTNDSRVVEAVYS